MILFHPAFRVFRSEFCFRILGLPCAAGLVGLGILLFSFSTFAQSLPLQIKADELMVLKNEGVVLIDIRTEDEWRQTGVVEGSHRVTFFDANGNYDANTWINTIGEFTDKDKPVVLICLSGSRSRVVTNWMANKLGYSAVYNYQPGIQEWLRLGLPVEQVN